MIGFHVSVNGKPLYTMTAGKTGMLKAEIEWWRGLVKDHGILELASVRGIGLDSDGDDVDWPRNQLKVGDEVTVRIVNDDTGSSPVPAIVEPPQLSRLASAPNPDSN